MGLSNKDAKVAHYVRGLRDFAETFEEAKLKTTANWLTLFISGILSDHPLSSSDYEKAYAEFRTELQNTFRISPDVLTELERLLSYPTTPSQKMNEQAAAFLKETKAKVKMVNKIRLTLRHGNLDQEQLFYGNCFVYLILMEGVFDTLLSLLCAWSEASAGRPVQSKNIEIAKQSLPLLHDRHGVHSLQEEYWGDRGHLRNAIAHARFSYDPKDGGHFLDLHGGKDEVISAYNLDRKVVALYDLAAVVLLLLIMRLSVRDALLNFAGRQE